MAKGLATSEERVCEIGYETEIGSHTSLAENVVVGCNSMIVGGDIEEARPWGAPVDLIKKERDVVDCVGQEPAATWLHSQRA